MLQVERLTKYYGALVGIRDLSFEARPGEVLRATLQLPSLDAVFAALVAEENVEERTRGLVAAMKA